jgi:hypothetical protein
VRRISRNEEQRKTSHRQGQHTNERDKNRCHVTSEPFWDLLTTLNLRSTLLGCNAANRVYCRQVYRLASIDVHRRKYSSISVFQLRRLSLRLPAG